MPTIRIDNEVWSWLKSHAQPLEDTPNSVLRRIAGIGDAANGEPATGQHPVSRTPMRGSPPLDGTHMRRVGRRVSSGLSGRQLNIEWNVGAKHPLFHKDGTYYNHLEHFPGALFDMDGYLLFKTEEQYRKSSYLQHGKQLHVPGGIKSVPGYVRKRK